MGFGGLEPFQQIMVLAIIGCFIYGIASSGKGKGGKSGGGQ